MYLRKKKKEVKIVYAQECEDRSDASKKEYAIKQLTRKQKLDLILWKKELSIW